MVVTNARPDAAPPAAGADARDAAVAPEQERYAAVLSWGTWIGLAVLCASFAAYVLEWLPAHVAFARLPELWGQPAAEFARVTGTPRRWDWIRFLHKGDINCLLGIAMLSACSVASLLAVVPIYLRRGDRLYVALCLLEVAVMALAASGVLVGGH
jgi:hypothetical protein